MTSITRHLRTTLAAWLLFFSLPAPAQTIQILPDLADQAFARLNDRRQTIGLPPLLRNPLLDQSALAHAKYLVINSSIRTEGHFESPKRLGYTGITPDARIRATGYNGNRTAENMALVDYPLGTLPTDNLIDAPFHREAEFGRYIEAGVALVATPAPRGSMNANHYIYVINFGKTNRSKSPEPIIVYPVNGQEDVATDWIANESPNPVPDLAGKPVGYPISIAVPPDDRLIIKSFDLVASNGTKPAIRLITSQKTGGPSLEHFAFIIPLQPLKTDMTYTSRVTGSINGQSFAKEWRFTTKHHTKLTLTASSTILDWNREPTVTVKIAGGTGGGYMINRVTQSFQSGQSIPGLPVLYQGEHPTPDTMILTKGPSTCTYPLRNCNITIRGSDSSGQEASLVIDVK